MKRVLNWLLPLTLGLGISPAPADVTELMPVTDCRYLGSENPVLAFDTNHRGTVWFPEGELFRPLLAEFRQPRFYMSIGRMRFEDLEFPEGRADLTVDAGITGIGTNFGIWRKTGRSRCEGVQVGVTAIIMSQFDLDAESDALINTDFLIGPTVSYRRGRFSTRGILFHQSSHLGDEFLLQNPDFDRINLSFEVLAWTTSWEGDWWRVYLGAGYLMGAVPELDPGIFQWGAEFRNPKRRWRTNLTPVAALDFNTMEARNWDVTHTIMAGVEMSNPRGTRRYRALLVYLDGYFPFGQFFNTATLKSFGIQFEFDY